MERKERYEFVERRLYLVPQKNGARGWWYGTLIQAVNARELHAFLGSKRQFTDWIKNRIEQYDFVENQDFTTVSKNLENGGRYRKK